MIFVLVSVVVGLVFLAVVTLLVGAIVRTVRSDRNPGGSR